MAFEAQAFDKAKIYANELLQSSPQQPEYARGGAIHHGNLVLGRLALRSGDVAQAKKYLLASGRTSGGPGLETAGPNMTLAKELLEHAEKEIVLEYFALCAVFWKMGASKIRQWRKEILKGQIPDFGRNLFY